MPIDYESYTTVALLRSIRKHEKRILEHESKIKEPSKYVEDWNERNEEYRQGLVAYWQREIKNFHLQIEHAKNELIRREKR